MGDGVLGYVAIGIACLVVIVLAIYAIRLLLQLKQQTVRQAQEIQAKKSANEAHDKKIISSVLIIAKAMKEEQCDFSEGCWRLSVLLASLRLSEGLEAQFPAIFAFYNEIKHMPILEERKKLTKQARMKLDYQRMKLETSFYDDINKDLNLLLQYAMERNAALSA